MENMVIMAEWHNSASPNAAAIDSEKKKNYLPLKASKSLGSQAR